MTAIEQAIKYITELDKLAERVDPRKWYNFVENYANEYDHFLNRYLIFYSLHPVPNLSYFRVVNWKYIIDKKWKDETRWAEYRRFRASGTYSPDDDTLAGFIDDVINVVAYQFKTDQDELRATLNDHPELQQAAQAHSKRTAALMQHLGRPDLLEGWQK